MNLQVKENPIATFPHSFGGQIFYPESDGKPMAETDKHAKLLIYLKQSLEIYFAERADVYVTGNIMFYYVEGDPTEVISPDVMVCFGVPKGDRTSYKTWEESDVIPSVIIEIASRGTWQKDRIEKRELYQMLGVKEYYIFNPQYPKTLPSFMAFRLKEGILESVAIENGRIKSDILGLELVDADKTLRLFNPITGEFLKGFEELAEKVAMDSLEIKQLKAENERLKQLLQNK
jgi:Uma2 family endonuclease